ncbi:DUF1360 domain-containing protein [Streptomyces chryseus]|uniref:DUF1360 domain-containing protein n=1 Tax=Streptomyces chryseus TaxID=68186 RepID=A0ABQ3DJE5_9ACTN|nr:DUF1360 domain-containing protein [Streptomyces chryseus]GGX37649.1 hypothetical protein GCM10010353_61290 [Streptomyces chryseus]GHA94592.1 hypothetical protein GCM10010346_16720 [Streptomyces chryseus]
MIDLTALALLGFAGYRATQLAVHDTILDPVRDRMHAWHERRSESAAREFVIALISCVYCMGWWLSGAILATYLLVTGQFDDAPLLIHGLEWFAVAGAAVFLNRVDDTLGRVG